MEILDLRHFTSTELRPLLEKETDVWAKQLSWDYRSSAEMILRYLDARILPGYAAIDRGRVQGYVFFVYEGAKGVIGDMFVANGNGSNGNGAARAQAPEPSPVESSLLKHVIETLQNSPGIHRIEAQLLVHPTGKVARPFVEEGFRRFPRLFMVLPLDAVNPVRAMAPDFDLRRWGESEFAGAATVITNAYRGHIDSEINDQYRTYAGSMRFLNNIVRFPGCGTFDPDASFVAMHRPSRTTAGVILCSRVRQDVGHVTQVCVVPEYRGKNVGEGLMAASIDALQRYGLKGLSLTVTEANTGAVALYKRLGFSINRVFDAFVWEG